MEEMKTQRSLIDISAGRTAEGQLGVVITLYPGAIVNLTSGEARAGVVFAPWVARSFAWALLHQAEQVEHGAAAIDGATPASESKGEAEPSENLSRPN